MIFIFTLPVLQTLSYKYIHIILLITLIAQGPLFSLMRLCDQWLIEYSVSEENKVPSRIPVPVEEKEEKLHYISFDNEYSGLKGLYVQFRTSFLPFDEKIDPLLAKVPVPPPEPQV